MLTSRMAFAAVIDNVYLGGATTSHAQPARKHKPPNGVTAPSQRRFVSASRYKLPLNSRMPINSIKQAPRLMVP